MSASPVPAKKQWSTSDDYGCTDVQVDSYGVHLQTSCDATQRWYQRMCALHEYRTEVPAPGFTSIRATIESSFSPGERAEIEAYIAELALLPPPLPRPKKAPPSSASGFLATLKRFFGSGS